MRARPIFCLTIVATIWLGIESVSHADSPDAPADNNPAPPARVLRVYDLRNFLSEQGNYPLTPSLQQPMRRPLSSHVPPDPSSSNNTVDQNPSAGPSNAPPPDPVADRLDGLVDLIRQAAEPSDIGVETIFSELQGKLYVLATPDRQSRIQKIIDQANDVHHCVNITATWLSLNDQQLAALHDPHSSNPSDGILQLSDALLAKQGIKPFAKASILCSNGQTVHITSAGGKVMLQVLPVFVPSKTDAIVDVLEVVATDGRPAMNGSPASAAQHFQTTTRIPRGKDVVIGGMTMNGPADHDPKQLYLVMRVDAE